MVKTEVQKEQMLRQGSTVRRVTWIGLGANLLLAALKLIGGIVGHSQVVFVDAFHSLTDCSSDVTILIGAKYWTKPPDKTHPHGHRRIETIVTFGISLLLGSVAVGLGYNALSTIQTNGTDIPGWVAFVAAVVSIVTKEALYRWTVRKGKEVKSSSVIANAWHHRSDALSSIPAALAVLAATINPDWAFVDRVGALLVSLLVLYAAWKVGWPALRELADAGASADERRRIRTLAADVAGVRDVHAVRTRYSGSGIQVDLHVLVDPDMTVRASHEIASRVKHRLLDDGPDVLDAVVHIEPFGDDLGGD